jgi:phosphopantetheine adenylyltransferase
MSISHVDSISVKTVSVLRSNLVIADCASEEDADILIRAIKKFSVWDYDVFRKDKGDRMISIYEGHLLWLDDLIENRKKYKSIK